VPVDLVAAAGSIPPTDVVASTHGPVVVSVGLPFVVAEVRDRASLVRLRASTAAFEALADLLGGGLAACLYLYAREPRSPGADGVDLRARMFAPLTGVPEDPATGSAGCAVVGLLAHHEAAPSGDFLYTIAQGVEMGRPSLLHGRARKAAGRVEATWIAGASVLVSEGVLHLD
jgi:trans-2,3-dihydro-3-hydroxyanthranilate isomerase